MECSCRLCPTPGMYVVTSIPFVRRTRATFRSAEFGFFGVDVKTRTHTPRFWGEPWSAGLSVFDRSLLRPSRTSWLTVGTRPPEKPGGEKGRPPGAPDPEEDNLVSVYKKSWLSRGLDASGLESAWWAASTGGPPGPAGSWRMPTGRPRRRYHALLCS